MATAEDELTKSRSIVIVDMPVEFINRDVLKKHFEKFGSVERIACSVTKKYAVLHFSKPEEARNAEMNGLIIKEGAEPLKIYNRSIGIGENKGPKAVSASTSQRVVTRRKIVRNITGGASVSVPNTPAKKTPSASEGMSPSPASATDTVADACESQEESSQSSSRPIASTSKFQQAPLRSSIKISRPSPYLRKKPSFGDKAGGKLPVGRGVAARNPFALPPRSMLSLDRRRRTTDETSPKKSLTEFKSTDESVKQVKIGSSTLAPTPSTSWEGMLQRNTPDSAEIPLSDDEQDQSGGELPSTSKGVNKLPKVQQKESTGFSKETTEMPVSSNVDVDEESTEDATFHDDSTNEPDIEEDNDDYKKDPDYDPLDDAETDTQNTAEATTEEEEGEILDDDDEERDEDEEEYEEPYESPLKRMAKTATATTASASSGKEGTFSFKLTQAKKSGSDSSSLFKLPFASPFSFGDGPKPFSGFGGATSIFPGSSSSQSSSKTKDQIISSKETDTPKDIGGVQVERKSESSTSVEQSKPKLAPSTFSFGMLSSFGGNKAPIFGSSATSSIPSSSSKPSTSSTSNVEIKKSSVSAPKPASSSSSTHQTAGTSSAFTLSQSTASIKMGKKQQPPQAQPLKDMPNPLLLTFNPDTTEAQELFSRKANNVEDRYRILEARDKLIRARIPKTKVNVEFATKLIGTCPDMCPEKERYMRQFQRQLVSYEVLPGQDVSVDHQKAIKAYSRSSADQEEPLPHELRPGPTLDFTMHYLLRFIVPLGDNPDENLSDWYNFLWDRTRSIRKDITQQQIIDLTAVSLFEKCARLHIHCASRLCELDVHSFDPKLNDENLMKCIQSLEHLYEDLRRRQVNCPNEPEFRAYQIMMNLNEGDALYQAQQLPGWILNSEQVQIALKLHHSIYTKNFVAFFKTVETLPYMVACILHRYFFQVRSLALRCFIKAHCTLPKYETAITMTTLQRMLGYGPNQTLSFSYLCEAHGIHCDVEENKVILKRKLFYLPEFPSIYRENHLIDSKLHTSVAEAINGGPLPDIDFAARTPHSSFNENGQLIAGDIVGNGSNENQPPSGVFIPPEISSTNKAQSKPGLFGFPVQGSFSFGSFQQAKREPLPQPPPGPPPKPIKAIEAACDAATSKLIEESVQKDVTQLSQARLVEAKIVQEKQERRRQLEEIVEQVASETFARIFTEQTESLVRRQADVTLMKLQIVEDAARNAGAILLEESVLINLSISARTEIIIAKEYYHRLLNIAKNIFQRLRARFAIAKWIKYSRTKKLEREKEEEKRRELLWNFPVINSYSLSTKEVFKAFCGKSSAQPSLDKVDILRSPENVFSISNTRPKRKSDGDTSEYDFAHHAPRKLPRLTSGSNIRTSVGPEGQMLKKDWDFPVVDPYTRTNHQVLQAFCGASMLSNDSISPKITSFGSPSNRFLRSDNELDSFFIRRPKQSSNGSLTQEIRSKTQETTSALLKNVQDFLSNVKKETMESANSGAFKEKVEEFNKTCPDVSSYIERNAAGETNVSNMSSLESEDDDEADWMDTSSGILTGIFVEEDKLLNDIRRFTKQLNEENAKTWNTETFLNRIEI